MQLRYTCPGSATEMADIHDVSECSSSSLAVILHILEPFRAKAPAQWTVPPFQGLENFLSPLPGAIFGSKESQNAGQGITWSAFRKTLLGSKRVAIT